MNYSNYNALVRFDRLYLEYNIELFDIILKSCKRNNLTLNLYRWVIDDYNLC